MTDVLFAAIDNAPLVDEARQYLATAPAGALNVNAGFATTKFPLPQGRVARPRLLVRELSSAQWTLVEDAIAARPDAVQVAGTAAVSDLFTDPAHTAGTPIVPARHDVTFTCTCQPDTASPCVHSVALSHLLIRRLRTAPTPLFTLRGRPHQHLKARLRATDQQTTTLPATTAALTVPHSRPPESPEPPAVGPPPQPRLLPAQLVAPTLPLAPPPLPLPAPTDLGLGPAAPVLAGRATPAPHPLPSLAAMRALTADAAHRAASWLDGDDSMCPDTDTDLARFAALPHAAEFRQDIMDRLGLGIVALGHLQLAYAYGGAAGAATYLEPLTVHRDVLARAQADIQPLRPAPLATIDCEDNRLTDAAAGIQLRYGPDGRWHPYRAPYGTWQPVPGPSPAPDQAYRSARRS
jgi:hypothetical protein